MAIVDGDDTDSFDTAAADLDDVAVAVAVAVVAVAVVVELFNGLCPVRRCLAVVDVMRIVLDWRAIALNDNNDNGSDDCAHVGPMMSHNNPRYNDLSNGIWDTTVPFTRLSYKTRTVTAA
jgi:hypothetical protein